MTINTISATVASALTEAGLSEDTQSSYAEYVTAVEDALTERDYQITEAIVGALVENGLVSEEVALAHAERLGLSVRPQPEPEPEVEDEDEDETEDMSDGDKLSAILSGLQSIGERIEKLESAAQRNGISL